MKTLSMISTTVAVCLTAVPAFGQIGRTGSNRPNPTARSGGPGIGGGIGGAMGQEGLQLPPLKTRELENKALNSREQKRYDGLIAASKKRETAMNGRAANPAAELAFQFQLGAKQLKLGQEKDAEETFKKAWQAVPAMLKEARTAMVATGQVRSHMRALGLLIPRDPSLVLTLMTDLGEEQKAALDGFENPRQKLQMAGPIASTWFALMQAGQLEPEAAEKAAKWIILAPEMAVVDRPLLPEQQNAYHEQFTRATIEVNNKIQQLARRQMGQRGPAMNQEEQMAVDPAAMAMFEGKSAAIGRFMEAQVDFRWGQFRHGLIASKEGWKELLGYYRSNPRAASPMDAEVHFEALKQLDTRSPVQACILLNELDQAYRGMTQVDRFFGAQIADEWNRMASSLPLNAEMLERAVSWVEYVSKQGKEQQGKYGSSLETLQKKLDEARQAEGIAEKDVKGAKQRPERGGTERSVEQQPRERGAEQRGVGGRRGINIPREIDSTRQ